MTNKRYLTHVVSEDLNEKMVFIGGPRQVGKTTLATDLISTTCHNAIYLNWDDLADKETILQKRWSPDNDLIILDEIHKYPFWKTFVKGVFDKQKKRHRFLITGSARLDLYRKGGDSLQGRYFYYRLHPFSAQEVAIGRLNKTRPSPFDALQFERTIDQQVIDALYRFGGFPEPFLKQSQRALGRWQQNRNERLLREDIRELEPVREIGKLAMLHHALPHRAGQLLSLNALKEDVSASYSGVSHWMDILESFYYCYRIYPYTTNTVKSLKKEPKLYLWDWSEVRDEGSRFENMIAGHLLKFCHFLRDYEGLDMQLHFVRDKDKRELDFLVCVADKPWFGVEVKTTDTQIASSLRSLKNIVKVPFVYQVLKKPDVDYEDDHNIRVMSANKFLSALI